MNAYRQNPFHQKPKGIMKIISDTSQNMRVVSKVGKINTHRNQKKELSMLEEKFNKQKIFYIF